LIGPKNPAQGGGFAGRQQREGHIFTLLTQRKTFFLTNQKSSSKMSDILHVGSKMPFKKLDNNNKQEYVVAQILEAIEAGEYKIGDKLPSEMDLCDHIGVSRSSIREAFSALRLVGVIETRKGDGTFIASENWRKDSKKETFTVAEMFQHGGNTFETLEARRVVEPAVAEYASEMIKEENLSKILNALQNMKKAAGNNDFRRWHNENKKFHFAIVETTRNSPLIKYVKSLLNLFTNSDLGTELRKHYLTEDKYVKEAIEVHHAIYVGLRNRDKKKIRNAYSRHFDQVEKQLLGR
jgi:GntR family transcriptional repressor for pyruvate dehydrogenase complex